MSKIRTPEEVRDYVNSHCFENKFHSIAIQSLVISIYGREKEITKEINWKWAMKKAVNMGKPVITANDAINFIES